MICELYENKTTSYELILVDTFENCVKETLKVKCNSARLYQIKINQKNKLTSIGLTVHNDHGAKNLYVYDCTPQGNESLPQLLLILSHDRIGFQAILSRSMYNLLHTIITHWKG